MILPILHPADEPTPGLRYLLASELCIDPDPEITAILVEPVPERTLRDIVLDMIGAQND